MSIYATLWELKFPYPDQSWRDDKYIDVIGQGVPGHIGTPTPGYGYEDGDPYASFLPPPIPAPRDDEIDPLRAVVIVSGNSEEIRGQEYINPLIVLSGKEYASIPFPVLLQRIEDALEKKLEVGKL